MEYVTFEQGEQIISLLKGMRVIGWIIEAGVVSMATMMALSGRK